MNQAEVGAPCSNQDWDESHLRPLDQMEVKGYPFWGAVNVDLSSECPMEDHDEPKVLPKSQTRQPEPVDSMLSVCSSIPLYLCVHLE